MRRMMKLWARFRRRKGTVSIIAIVLGNAAALLGYIEKINQTLAGLFNFRLIEFIYRNLIITVSLVFLLGYTLAFYWFYQKVIKGYTGPRKVVSIVLAGLVVVGVFALNIAWLPPRPDPELTIRKQLDRWVEIVFRNQDRSTGGIRGKALDPSVPPQVWTTAQCLKGVLASPVDLQPYVVQIRGALSYIEKARHPRPDHSGEQEGWGLFEERPHTITEVTGWVALVEIAAVESKTKIWNDDELPAAVARIERDLNFLISRQADNGGWRPLMEESNDFNRTYASAIALWALVEAKRSPAVRQRIGDKYDDNISRGIAWLLSRYDDKLGWVPNPDRKPQNERYDGLTAQVLLVLSRAEKDFPFLETHHIYVNAEREFITHKELAMRRLNENNRYHDFDVAFRPTQFALEPSTFLWFPWTVAELTHLSSDATLSERERKQARDLRRDILAAHADDIGPFIESEFMYALGENLYCLSVSLEPKPTKPL
jgi:hypothetical protein